MKSILIGAAVVGAVAVGGVVLWRRGRTQEAATTVRGGAFDTIVTGAKQVWSGVRSAVPSTGAPGTTDAATPTQAAAEPRRSVAGKSAGRGRALSRVLRYPETWRDQIAQGRYPN